MPRGKQARPRQSISRSYRSTLMSFRFRSLLKLRRYRRSDSARATSPSRTGKKSALLYELRGQAEADHNDYSGAIRDYGRALELRPDDAGLLVSRGWAYLVFDSPKLALADFEAAIKLDPADGDAYNGRGTAQARLGDHARRRGRRPRGPPSRRANPRVTYNAARIYAIAASVAGCRGGRERPPGQAAFRQVPGHRRAIDPGGVRTRSPRETRGVLAGDGPARPGLEGDPAAAQVRGFDRHQQVAASS